MHISKEGDDRYKVIVPFLLHGKGGGIGNEGGDTCSGMYFYYKKSIYIKTYGIGTEDVFKKCSVI